jgi:hypothetical protein
LYFLLPKADFSPSTQICILYCTTLKKVGDEITRVRSKECDLHVVGEKQVFGEGK